MTFVRTLAARPADSSKPGARALSREPVGTGYVARVRGVAANPVAATITAPAVAPSPRGPYVLCIAAIVLHYVLSSNTLYVLGIDYASPGGNPLFKLHPATYAVALAAMMTLWDNRRQRLLIVPMFRERPALFSYMLLILLCAVYSMANVGISGAAVYIESYLSAGLLVVALEPMDARRRRNVAYIILGLTLFNALLGLGEAVAQTHIIPLYIGDQLAVDPAGEFRSAALYNHPLNGAMATAFGVFLVLAMRLPLPVTGPSLVILFAALLAFGGRTALGVVILLLPLAALAQLIRGLATRNLSAGFLGAIGAAAVVLPTLLGYLVSATNLGARIMGRLYYDDSAQARALQWRVFGCLDLNQTLFGVPLADTPALIFQVGLNPKNEDIENFWILMFLNLGAIGFVVFVVAFMFFLWHLWRMTSGYGRLLLIAGLIIVSSSNSLGRKSNDLFLLSACMLGTSAFRAEVVERARRPAAAGLAGGTGRAIAPLQVGDFPLRSLTRDTLRTQFRNLRAGPTPS